MLRICFIAIALIVGPGLALGGPADRLGQAMQLPQIMQIIADEGRAHADELETEMFPGQGGEAWRTVVGRIYDPAHGEALVLAQLDQALTEAQINDLVAFYDSPLGQRVTELEIEARKMMADTEVELAAIEQVLTMEQANDPRLDLVNRFIEVNDLIEYNVMGGLNSNYAFYLGLVDGGVFGDSLTQEEMLSDIWGQADALRGDTVEWMSAYLVMAYQPLSDTELQTYIDHSKSAQGRALNTALFAGFDIVFRRVSRELGLAASRFMAAKDI